MSSSCAHQFALLQRLQPPVHAASAALSSATTLPNEIVSAIFDGMPKDALTRLARVCSRWRDPAERLLYASVVISEPVLCRSPEPYKGLTLYGVPPLTLRVCETLSTNPHLAELVRRFHLRWQPEIEPGTTPSLLLSIAQEMITALLPRLVNVESLELALGLGNVANSPPLASKLSKCFMPNLRVLWLSGLRGVPECFLHNHPGLLHLRMPDYHMPLQLAPSDLPALASFRGSPAAAASVLPGRPVQSLALVGSEFVGEAVHRVAPVAALDLTGMSATPTLLRDIARTLPAIRALRVRLALRHTLPYALSGIRLLVAFTPALRSFRELQFLDLSPTSSELHLSTSWAEACPNLMRIAFPSKTEWSRDDGGQWSHV
ncbi:hypothetical protein PENSPDRAFT_644663 [Peniophora sp. CONT]|nr:hypothetical protein PENSPDRAFT_644663 [Peniophora sp. CONT]